MIYTRKIDELGRVVLPCEIRKCLTNISQFELFLQEDGTLVLKPLPACCLCGKTQGELELFRNRFLCSKCKENINT